MPHGTQQFGNTFAFETLTVSSTAGGKALTSTKYSTKTVPNSQANAAIGRNAKIAIITLDGAAGTNDIRWTTDGTAPVATTTGHLYQSKSAEPLVIYGMSNIVNFRAIREGGADGVIQVTYIE
jgi:hypothetical protein